MNVSRLFETSAIRHGFVINASHSYHSEVFTLNGFHFEFIAEKIEDMEKNDLSYLQNFHYQFYIHVYNLKVSSAF